MNVGVTVDRSWVIYCIGSGSTSPFCFTKNTDEEYLTFLITAYKSNAAIVGRQCDPGPSEEKPTWNDFDHIKKTLELMF